MTDVFFFSLDTFPCWQQKVKQILYFDKMNKNNKHAIFTYLYKYKLLFFSLCDNYYVDNKM